jgi:hypothetical protein
MDKILEALSKLLPADQMEGVKAAVEEMVNEVKAELEAEMNKNLDEAYAELTEELQEAEKVGEEGYRKAWDIITDLRNRIDTLRAEYDAALDEGYEEAYQQVLAERGKNETLETELHEEYEKRFNESKAYLVEKVDQFLRTKGKEIYEQARRDIMNDPSMVEHKIVLEKIVENVSDYITDEDRVFATSSKVEEVKKQLSDATARIKMLEAKNIRLDSENRKLNEHVKQAAEIITESKKVADDEAKKARVEKAKNATGRGKVSTEKTVEVVAEYADEDNKGGNDDGDTTLVENLAESDLHDFQVLAGIKTND